MKSIALQQQRIKEELRAAYALGNESRIKLILNQENPDTFSRMLRYHEYLVSARVARIDDYHRDVEKLNALETVFAETLAEREAVIRQLEQQHASLEESRSVRQKNISALALKYRQTGSEIERLKLDREQLEKVVVSVERHIRDVGATTEFKPFS
ncbi:MAG: hypothetical protein KDI30_01800, partial [Pseudomonadales bacterium]|nr:hypothetical protein [Pseudomonadales bacterium]